MISIDTNILVRAFLEDDPLQAKEAQEIMSAATEDRGLFVSSYALLEFVWVLKVKNISKAKIYESLMTLIESPNVIVGQRSVVIKACELYINGNADFGDYMIYAEGALNGTKAVESFDIKFKKFLNVQK